MLIVQWRNKSSRQPIVKQRTCYRWECREVRPGLVMLKGSNENLRVLGLGWNPKSDNVGFGVTLNFSKKKREVRTGPNLVEVDLPQALPDILSRQIVPEQVMRIYDPLGLVYSFTLIAKVYLRKTWSRILEWDNRLPVTSSPSGSSSSPLFSSWCC